MAQTTSEILIATETKLKVINIHHHVRSQLRKRVNFPFLHSFNCTAAVHLKRKGGRDALSLALATNLNLKPIYTHHELVKTFQKIIWVVPVTHIRMRKPIFRWCFYCQQVTLQREQNLALASTWDRHRHDHMCNNVPYWLAAFTHNQMLKINLKFRQLIGLFLYISDPLAPEPTKFTTRGYLIIN